MSSLLSTRSVCRAAIGLLSLLVPLVTMLPARAAAQFVRVRVTDDISDAPIPDALVTSLTDRSQWRADPEGYLVFRVKQSGTNVFTIRRFGFAPATTTLNIPEHDTLKVHVIMHPLGLTLDTVNVTAQAMAASGFRMSQFDQRRMHSAGGHFITRADIDRRQPFSTIDLFKNTLGVEVHRSSRFQTRITSSRGSSIRGGCTMSVGVDGSVFGHASDDDFDVDDIPPSDIYGIEIYSGPATIPAQFVGMVGGNACGLIMIWTRGGPGQSRAP